jgi:sugar lactone lactonase YvrE
MKIFLYLLIFLVGLTTIEAQIITTIAGNGKTGFTGDGGQAIAARLNLPVNLTFDKNQNIYIADTYNNSIRRIDSETGIITTIVRNNNKFAVDGLKTPTGIAFDEKDNLYIAELENERIRRVNIESGKEMTLVGTKSETESPNINYDMAGPFNVVFDKEGNLYVSVPGESKIRRVDFATGDITDAAGTDEIGFSGDGKLATNARISNPTGMVIDDKGNLYFSDTGNDRIRKINTNTGIITTIAGTGSKKSTKDDVLALKTNLSNPLGLAVDKDGNLFFVDRGSNRVRKIDITTNNVTTIAGTGKSGFSGDEGPATAAKLSNPTGIAFDKVGNLYIVDRGNNRIRKISGL